jgi:NADPH:quinone reductase-like Zn-dependent oxidoreductase
MNQIVQFTSLGGPEVLEFVSNTPAPPLEGEVQIAVKAAGLNRAELLFLAGTYLVDPVLPSGLGFEGAGEVVDIGPGVDSFSIGDRVAVTPAFKQEEYGVLGHVVNISVTALEPIADGVSYLDAAAFWMAFGTAYGMLVQQGGLREGAGQYVVINAASSSVGTAAFQIIRAHGGTSIATTRDPGKIIGLKEAGADHVIVTTQEELTARILEITGGKGFDIACDAVGGKDGDALANAAGFEATLVVYGGLSGESAPVPFYPMVSCGLIVKGFHLAWLMLDHPERRRIAVDHLNEGLANDTYNPRIDKVFFFSELADAYRHMASNAQLGKIVVEMNQ